MDSTGSDFAILIRCDKDAPSGMLLEILALFATEDLRVANVLLEVALKRDDRR